MIVNIQDDILFLHSIGVLDSLLRDKTTEQHILWATDAFSKNGTQYGRYDEILPELVAGLNASLIKTRARKEMEQQASRTKQHAEVFTPLWICKKMIDYLEEDWNSGEEEKDWKQYIDSRRLEITCGEAPFLATRYDVETGEAIEVPERIGILDRKLHAVSDHAESEEEWCKWALRALEATYGYEYQGDNLLIARVNLLMTYAEHMAYRWKRKPTKKEYCAAANVIAWNAWQMDGLTGTVPNHEVADEEPQITMDFLMADMPVVHELPPCQIFDWRSRRSVTYQSLKERRNTAMKFDYIIGNPPYQEETAQSGDRPNPIYNKFMDAAFSLSQTVELIHPARFLFDAGQTPKLWNKKMLNDPHLRVMYYEPNAAAIFKNTEIKGGVAITLRDEKKACGAIGTFTAFQELNTIVKKTSKEDNARLDIIIESQGLYRFSERFFAEHPKARAAIGAGTGSKIVSSVITNLPDIFLDSVDDKKDFVRMLGRVNNRRVYKYIRREYIVENDQIDAFNLFIPEANNSGTYGETLTEPILGYPGDGTTDTFLCAGPFSSEKEAKNLTRYIKTKFFRALLGVKKVTQHCPPTVWRTIPLQDFTDQSDIDWSKSIPEIDRQLYTKYGLDETEVAFIESHVKEMS